mgnify:FL=1
MRTRSIHKAALTDAVTPLEEAGKKLAYEAAVEGIVLLENDGCLPVNPKINHGKLALYGAGAKMTIKGGTGSGEVNERHVVSILEEWNMRDLRLQRWTGLMIMIRVFRKENARTQKNFARN